MAEPPSRVTVVEQVYHQILNGQPHLVESRFSRDLESDEQAYERRLKVGEAGVPLDCGWVTKASQLLIINEEGRNLQVNPTDEERKKLSEKVLEVYYVQSLTSPWLVLPGESMRGCPSTLEGLRIRSQSGIIRFTLHVIPK